MLPKEFNWLLTHPEIETQYPGEYIAIIGETILAHNKDLKKVLKIAEQSDGKPFIHKIQPLDKVLVV